jgi:hypothetical protein
MVCVGKPTIRLYLCHLVIGSIKVCIVLVNLSALNIIGDIRHACA